MAQPSSNGQLAVRPLVVEVRSESDPDAAYQVTLAHCTCRDFYYRRGSADSPFCKHIVAAYAQAGGWHGLRLV
jgi:hypothetical protein